MATQREVAERAGVNVDALIDRLTSVARAELAVVYQHTILGGHTEEGLRRILTDVRQEHRRHFEELATRIYELDGRLPQTIQLFAADNTQHDALLSDPDDPLTALIESERQATRTYAELCDLTEGKDRRTHALVAAIRNEETEHEAWFSEFRGTGPPGRFRPGFRGRSPFLARLADDPEEDPAG